MIKKISALLLVFLMLFAFSACGKKDSDTTVKNVDNSIKKGTPAPIGDIFEMEEITPASGAPIIGQITPQANPDDGIMLAGEGFSSAGLKAYVYAQSEKSNGKAYPAEFTVIDDQKLQLNIPKDIEYGVYGVYLENSAGKGNVKLINTPKVWFVGYNHLAAGEPLDIYGENLTTDNKTDTSVFLVAEGEYAELNIVYSDPYKITAEIPDTLTADKQYEIYVHNGHGGKYGFAVADEKITYIEKSAVMYEGKVIDVTEFGADPKDNANDDTQAVKDALRTANAGDILYFPKGVYFLSDTIEINQPIRLCGDGKENTVFVMANAVKDKLFNVSSGPVEFVNLGFWHKRTTGVMRAKFILAFHVEPLEYEYSLKVTNCKFVQSVAPESRSFEHPIYAQDADGLIVENNEFDSTGIVGAYGCSRIRVRNNKALMNMYVGLYYHQNTTIFTNCSELDFSNNQIQGKDILEDDTGMLRDDNLTVGRAIAVQGSGKNFYIANNKFERTGLPNDNAGEQIMLENLSCVYEGPISEADANTLTLPSGFQAATGYIISITSGKGQSQYRKIKSIKKYTITVDEPWDVVPDASSRVHISNCFNNIAVTKNNIDGYKNYLSNPGATTGIQVYGSTQNLYYTDNSIKNVPSGICIQPYYIEKDGLKSKTVISWNMFDGNKIESCGEGIRFLCDYDTNNQEFECSYGIVFRRMTVKMIESYLTAPTTAWYTRGGKGAAIGVYEMEDKGYQYKDNGINGVLLDHINFEKCEDTDLMLYSLQNNIIVRECTSANGELKINKAPAANDVFKVIK